MRPRIPTRAMSLRTGRSLVPTIGGGHRSPGIGHPNPEVASEVNDAVMDVAGSIHAKFGPATRTYFVARRLVNDMHRSGTLNDAAIAGFAKERKLEEIFAAHDLSLRDAAAGIGERPGVTLVDAPRESPE